MPKTPHYFFVIGSFMAVIMYCLYGGIEVFARTGEVFFPFLFLIAVFTWVIVYSSHVVDIQRLTPILEKKGIGTVWDAAFPLTISFPFGEMVLFMMLWPVLHNPKKVKKVGMMVVLAAGIFIDCEYDEHHF
ncbi:hypothetical protein GCM10020331_022100 [Ectobacillus funiculus]